MRFEKAIEVDASPQRLWAVLADLERWVEIIETVDSVELLTPPPIHLGSRVRLEQPKIPEGVWTVTAWQPPRYFEWTQKSSGVTSTAGHRVDSLGPDRARLTLTLDMRGVLIPIVGRFYSHLTNDYMQREAEGMKRAAEKPAS